jgi:hypothetical protein
LTFVSVFVDFLLNFPFCFVLFSDTGCFYGAQAGLEFARLLPLPSSVGINDFDFFFFK